MVNLADLDTTFLVPCKHCDQLLPEGERFCPFCGKDQTVADGALEASWDAELERIASGGAAAPTPVARESAFMPLQEEQEAYGAPVPTSAPKEEAEPEVDLVRPGAFWQKEVLEGGGPEDWAERPASPSRLVIGIVAALVALFLLAVGYDHFSADKPSEPARLREFRANVEQMQSALSRGDLGAAERVLHVLDAEYANAPGVQELREAFDRRVQEKAAKQQPPGDAATKAAKALAPGEPAAPPARAPLPSAAPVAASPAPGTGVAEPKEKECNAALAALALCANR